MKSDIITTAKSQPKCGGIRPVEFDRAARAKCQSCPWLSGKKTWCGFHGVWIVKRNRPIIRKPETQKPGLITMGKSFAKAGLKHLASGLKKRSRREQERVIKICAGCEYYQATSRIGPRCRKCGCKIQLKLTWATAHCPLGLW